MEQLELPFPRLLITKHEYEFLIGEGPEQWGAWHTACFEFCKGHGLYKREGEDYVLTDKGRDQIELFKKTLDKQDNS